MNKNYKAALDEAAWPNPLDHNQCPTSFKAGAEFAFNYQQAKIDKLVEALKFYANEDNLNWGWANEERTKITTTYEEDSGDKARETLAQLEKDANNE